MRFLGDDVERRFDNGDRDEYINDEDEDGEDEDEEKEEDEDDEE